MMPHQGIRSPRGLRMRAVVCQNAELRVEDLPDPTPGKGQVLLEVLRCGICGSDLHARHHCDHWAGLMVGNGYPGFMRSNQKVVFGHEFCGEVLAHGKDCRRTLKTGSRVCALPIRRVDGNFELTGLSAAAPGAFAERVVVEEPLMVEVPNGLSPDLAALTEPMAVGWHAVARSEVGKGQVAIVVGCGPVGLAVVSILKARGVETVIACDFAPGRRALATRLGADIVLDPRQDSPYADSGRYAHIDGFNNLLDLLFSTREKLGRLPIPWHISWRAVEALGVKPKAPVIFECVGVPGVIQGIIAGAPLFSRVVVVGVCMKADSIEPAMAINKEIDLRFVIAYTPLEYRDTLHAIAEGKVDCAALITGMVGLDGVDAAFSALGDPEQHAKILIDPRSAAREPVARQTAA
jgi:threonine dehydrogenase-like Zn-dependent dehydrogenase